MKQKWITDRPPEAKHDLDEVWVTRKTSRNAYVQTMFVHAAQEFWHENYKMSSPVIAWMPKQPKPEPYGGEQL